MKYTLLLLLILTLGACAPSQTTQIRYVTTQRAALPAPSSPTQVGTLAKEGEVYAQGGVHRTITKPAENHIDNENIGHQMMNTTFHGSIAYGLANDMELSLRGQYGTHLLSMPLSTYEPSTKIKRVHSMWMHAQLRYTIFGEPEHGVVATAGLSTGRVPFVRHVETTREIELFHGERVSETSEYSVRSAEMYTTVNAGMQGFFSIHPAVVLTGGFSAQSYPLFFARRVTSETCTIEAGTENCPGEANPRNISPYEMVGLVTVFAGGSYHTNGPWSIHANGFYIAHGPSVLKRTASMGADLRLRYSF